MNIELSEQDLKLIRTSLSKFYAELCERKKKLKSMIKTNVDHVSGISSIFYDLHNPHKNLKEINTKLDEILNLENRVFIQNNAPIKKGG